MSLLFRIVYAAHANGTHHKLALDGLRTLSGGEADAWTRLFLKHADRFMEGAKAPDDKFKDFKNHVLHIGDDYWGGAPEATLDWYGKTVAALKAQAWEDAVYAAGVTSHYYTDPVMPFHTGQTEAENAIHRAAEWSINRSYDDLRKIGEGRAASIEVRNREGADWLKAMVCDGAEASHRSYEKLIAHYDIHRGITDPPAGLDGVARGLVAELLIYAATGYGRILSMAIEEAKVSPPAVSLTLDTIMAAIKIPAKRLAKRLTNAEDRAIVEAMYDELKATGKVERTLPEDDRMVRDLHAKEVLAPKMARQAAARTARLKATPVAAPATPKVSPAAASAIADRTEAALTGTPTPRPVPRVTPPAPPREQPAVASHQSAAIKPVAVPTPAAAVPGPAVAPSQPVAQPQGLVSRLASGPNVVTPQVSVPSAATPAAAVVGPPATVVTPPAATSVPSIGVPSTDRGIKSYLAATDQLEAAPSIGPKMAERFATLGIKTVADFMGGKPADIATRLADRRIDAATIEQWQAQAALVMAIAGLRGTAAQLLTGAGFKTAASIAAADPAKLVASVMQFAQSTDGKRLLRDGPPPEADKIKAWIDLAKAAAKAA